jgi:DNA-binding protein H-NS
MATLPELIAAKADIDAQIRAAKAEAVEGIKAWMLQVGVTVADLGPTPRTPGAAVKRAVKYRDGNGNTWTGIGQRPRWVRAALLAGAELDSFRILG